MVSFWSMLVVNPLLCPTVVAAVGICDAQAELIGATADPLESAEVLSLMQLRNTISPDSDQPTWNLQDAGSLLATWPGRSASRAVWESLFEKAMSAEGIGVLCMPPVVHGMGSRLNNYVNEVLLAMVLDLPTQLCSEQLSEVSKFFKDRQVKLNAPSYCPTSYWQVVKNVQIWDVPQVLNKTKSGKEELTRLKRFLYGKLLTPTDEFAEHVKKVQRQLDLEDPTTDYIGVHIRHGDKGIESDLLDEEKYAESIAQASQKPNGLSFIEARSNLFDRCVSAVRRHSRGDATVVFLATDDARARKRLQEGLGDGFRVIEQPRLDVAAYVERGTQYSDDGLRQLFTDVALLAKSRAFIGTGSSNVGRLVYFQRDQDSVSESLDDDWLQHHG